MTKTVKHRRGGAFFSTRKAQIAPLQTIPTIFEFITEGNLVNVKAALKNLGWDRSYKNTEGNTAILHALYKKSLVSPPLNIDEIIKDIIADATGKKEVSLTVKNSDDYTPLLYAIDKGYNNIAKLLIAKNISVLSGVYNGNTPLLLAIDKQDVNTVKEILNKLPNGDPLLSRTNKSFQTPLLLAIEKGNPQIIQAILDKKVSLTDRQIGTDKKGNTPLLAALRKKNEKTSKKILEDKSTLHVIDKDGYTPLLLAIENGLSDTLITQLIEKNIALVIRKGADGKGDTPLLLTIKKSREKIALTLIEQFPKVFYIKSTGLGDKDSNGKTPLQLAIEMDMKKVAEKLIDAKAEINTVDSDGNTPLLLAIKRNMKTVAEKLIDAKAGINTVNTDGNTPLLLLASVVSDPKRDANDIKVVEKLIAAKVKLDVTNKDGETAVMVACKNNKPTIAEKLINAGADVKKRSITGRGAMYYCQNNVLNATKKGKIATLLVEKGNAVEVNTTTNPEAKTEGRNKAVGVSIINAIREGKPEKALQIINKSIAENAEISFDIHSDDGSTPLIEAVNKGYADIINRLLSNADINFKDKNGTTGFIEAIKKGNRAIFELFIGSAKLELDLADRDGIQPLIWAFQKNNLDLVKSILSNKWKADTGRTGPEALCYACDISNKVEAKAITTLLLQAHANPNNKVISGRYKNILPADKCFSLWRNEPDILKILESVKLVKQLLDDIYYNRESNALDLIMALASKRDKPEYQAILKTKNKYNYTPLGLAIYYGRNSVVEALLEAGADAEDVDDNGSTPLHIAAHNNPMLENFLSKEAEDKLFSKINRFDIINLKDKYGKTALYWLFKNRMQSTAIKLLAKEGIEIPDDVAVLATINWPDMEKANKIAKDMLKMKAKEKAKANAKNKTAAEALEAQRISNAKKANEARQIAENAVATSTSLVTQLTKAITDPLNKNESRRLRARASALITLLSAKAPDEFKKVTNDGQTFLTWAVTKGNLQIVRELLAVNQSMVEDNKFINIKTTRSNETPLMIACRSGQGDIAQALLDAGADIEGAERACASQPDMAAITEAIQLRSFTYREPDWSTPPDPPESTNALREVSSVAPSSSAGIPAPQTKSGPIANSNRNPASAQLPPPISPPSSSGISPDPFAHLFNSNGSAILNNSSPVSSTSAQLPPPSPVSPASAQLHPPSPVAPPSVSVRPPGTRRELFPPPPPPPPGEDPPLVYTLNPSSRRSKLPSGHKSYSNKERAAAKAARSAVYNSNTENEDNGSSQSSTKTVRRKRNETNQLKRAALLKKRNNELNATLKKLTSNAAQEKDPGKKATIERQIRGIQDTIALKSYRPLTPQGHTLQDTLKRLLKRASTTKDPERKAELLEQARVIKQQLSPSSNYTVAETTAINPLFAAIIDSKEQLAIDMITTDATNINTADAEGKTPLMIAIEKGQFRLANKLIELDANTRAKDEDDMSVLVYACESGNSEIARAVLATLSPPEQEASLKNSAIKSACARIDWSKPKEVEVVSTTAPHLEALDPEEAKRASNERLAAAKARKIQEEKEKREQIALAIEDIEKKEPPPITDAEAKIKGNELLAFIRGITGTFTEEQIIEMIKLIHEGADLSTKEKGGFNDSLLMKTIKANAFEVAEYMIKKISTMEEEARKAILNYKPTTDTSLTLLYKNLQKDTEGSHTADFKHLAASMIAAGADSTNVKKLINDNLRSKGVTALTGGRRKTRHRKIQNRKTPRRSAFKTQKRR